MDLVDPTAFLFGELFVLNQHLGRLADEILEPAGITGRQWLLLVVLMRGFEEPPTLSEAAHVYGTSRQNIKQLADQLQRRGYLEVSHDPDDKRALRLHLTEKVNDFDKPEMVEARKTLFHEAFSPLSNEELRELHRLVTILINAKAGRSPR